MRRAGKRPEITRSIVLCALSFLAVVEGCAQIVGIDPWKPSADCQVSEVDPEMCVPPASCTECLYAQQDVCEMKRMDCVSDPMSTCQTIYSCAQQCETVSDTVSCIEGCCKASSGDTEYDIYLTCLCTSCEAECGVLTLGCESFCD